MKSLLRFAVLLATLLASIAAVAAPAGATAATYPPPQCWTEADTWVTGATVKATAVKDCTNDDPPQNLSVTLETQVCDAGNCVWVGWKSGIGYVSFTCPPNTFWYFRSSRLRSKVVSCDTY
jgi:hypothetical protein